MLNESDWNLNESLIENKNNCIEIQYVPRKLENDKEKTLINRETEAVFRR